MTLAILASSVAVAGAQDDPLIYYGCPAAVPGICGIAPTGGGILKVLSTTRAVYELEAARTENRLGYVLAGGPFQPIILDVNGANPVALTLDGFGKNFASVVFAWAPDGSRLAYPCGYDDAAGRHVDLCTVLPDGTDPKNLGTLAGVAANQVGGFSWSPDGKEIAFHYISGHAPTVIPDGSGIRVVTLATGAVRDIIFAATANGSAKYSVPSWSPGGDKIAFVTVNGTVGPCDNVFVAPANGGGAAVPQTSFVGCTPFSAGFSQVRWSPDGKRLAFLRVRYDGGGTQDARYDLMSLPLDGSAATPLVSGLDSRGLTWGPDVSPLIVTLSAGVTNGKMFSIDVTVKNGGKVPLTDVAFANPDGIIDTEIGDPAVRGKISRLFGPDPELPATLAPGQSATSTVTFSVEKEGAIDLGSVVTAVDDVQAAKTDSAHALVQIGRRPITPADLKRVYSDALGDASETAGRLLLAANVRLGLVMAWAAGPNGADTVPSWLTGPITETPLFPPGTEIIEEVGLNVSAARALGMDDRALSWVPDGPTAVEAIAEFALRYQEAGLRKIDQYGHAAYHGVRNAGEFYIQLASGNEGFRAEAARQLNGMANDFVDGVLPVIGLLGAISAYSHDGPLADDIRTYENSKPLQEFTKQSAAVTDVALKGIYNKAAQLVRTAKDHPVAAAGQIGDLLGETYTTIAVDIAVAEVGVAGISRLGKAIEGALPFARTGTRLDAGLAAADPAAAALAGTIDGNGEVVVRQALESLAEGSTITIEQLEQLGGFYGADAPRVQAIINQINKDFGTKIELQCRPGNPASIEFYRNGTGVPKPEWIKPKNTEWMDLALGAPKESLGKATVFKPVQPSPATLSKYTQAQQQTILARYETQLGIYEDWKNPSSSFAKLLVDSQKAEGATVSVGIGTGKRDITGLKYSLRAVGDAEREAYLIIDDAAGGKFVLSDADWQALVNADDLKHLSSKRRGQLEIRVGQLLGKDTVSFGGHGHSHSGFDMSSKYSKPFIGFNTEYTNPAAARRTLEWFVGKGDFPEWLHKIHIDLALQLGHPPTNAELITRLLDIYRPGNFVIKFNGTDIRVGYGAGLR